MPHRKSEPLLDKGRQRDAAPRSFALCPVEERIVEPNRRSHMSEHTRRYVYMSNRVSCHRPAAEGEAAAWHFEIALRLHVEDVANPEGGTP